MTPRTFVWVRRALGLGALGVLVPLLWSLREHESVMAWMRESGPLPYFALMALLPAIGAPFTPFFLVAGATFGIPVGLIGSGLALAMTLTLCHRLARTRLRPLFESLARRFGYEIPDFEKVGNRAVRFTLMVKLAPGVPAFIKNYGLGAAGVPFPLYFGISMLITGVYALCLVVLGESLFQHELTHAVVAAAVIVVLALGVWWWRRRRRDRSRRREQFHQGSTSAPGARRQV